MNPKDANNLTANGFRRILAVQDRQSSINSFPMSNELEVQLDHKPDTMAGKEDKLEDGKLAETKRMLSLQDWALFPPLSKKHGLRPDAKAGDKNANPSYSFYTRDFRVKGKKAWENAMRDLGSVETLFNRYGFMEPPLRSGDASLKAEQKSQS